MTTRVQFEQFDASRIDWPVALQRLGLHEDFLSSKQGPCPLCGGKTRFRMPRQWALTGGWVCNQCGGGDGVSLLMQLNGWDFIKTKQEIMGEKTHQVDPEIARKRVEESRRIQARENAKKRSFIRSWWTRAVPAIEESVASQYLRSRIPGLDVGRVGSALRSLKLEYFGQIMTSQVFPCLLSAMQDVEGKLRMLHRTYLDPNGGKLQVVDAKKTYSAEWVPGCAIRLGRQSNLTVLGVAEGIETALACLVANDYAYPVWSAYCADNLEALLLPAETRVVHLFADNDKPTARYPDGHGLTACKRLAKRLAEEGREVHLHLPKNVGEDFADVWKWRFENS